MTRSSSRTRGAGFPAHVGGGGRVQPGLREVSFERDDWFRAVLAEIVTQAVEEESIQADVYPLAVAVVLVGQLRRIGLQLRLTPDSPPTSRFDTSPGRGSARPDQPADRASRRLRSGARTPNRTFLPPEEGAPPRAPSGPSIGRAYASRALFRPERQRPAVGSTQLPFMDPRQVPFTGTVGCKTESSKALPRRCMPATYSGSRPIRPKARRLGYFTNMTASHCSTEGSGGCRTCQRRPASRRISYGPRRVLDVRTLATRRLEEADSKVLIGMTPQLFAEPCCPRRQSTWCEAAGRSRRR